MSDDLTIIHNLQAGMKAEALRQKAIASNVANLNTPGYRRIELNFEQLLEKAIDSGKEFDFDKHEPEYYNPGNTPVKSNGNDVSLDHEVSEMVKNTLRHSAYTKLLKKKYDMFALAIKTSG